MKISGGAKSADGFTLIELMVVVAIIGILAAIAIPNFVKFQARSKQTEARSNLKALFQAERAYFQEKDSYCETMSGVGFAPERGNRYYYALLPASGIQDRSGPTLSTVPYAAVEADSFKYGGSATFGFGGTAVTYTVELGAIPLTGTAVVNLGGQGGFAAFAAGSIDSETAGLDTWSIASSGGTLTTSACTAQDTNAIAGEPVMVYNDVSCD